MNKGYTDFSREQLVPFFQPIVEISSGMITAYEALARYKNEDGSAISAAHLFTDPNITLELQRELDQHVRIQALSRAIELPENTRLTLNISPELIEYSDGVPIIRTLEMMESLAIPNNKVVIELVETSGDLDDLLKLIRSYRSAGLRIAVDDFGAGFSHFDRVIAFAPDIIKLDMRLLKKALSEEIFAKAAVECIVSFCEKSGALIVIEGVETQEEFDFGLRCGAHYMQGYLFSAAVDGFLAKDAFFDQIAELRTQYFESSRKKEELILAQDRSLLKKLNVIQEKSHLAGFISSDIEEELRNVDQLIRYFLTDYEGSQESPNYSLSTEKIFEDEGTAWQYMNWSWRPYFARASCMRRAIISDHYHDLHSGKTCKTFVVRLGNGQMLLIDVLVND